MSDSFGFKRSKGRRNIRKREDHDAGDMLGDEAPVDIVKRSSKAAGKASAPISAMSSMSVGSEAVDDSLPTQRARTNLQFKRIVDETKDSAEADARTYSIKELEELSSETARPKERVDGDGEAQRKVYPFSNEGIPDAQEIYMAKKLRRQRQAALAAEKSDSDSPDIQGSLSVDFGQGRDNTRDGFIPLSSGFAGNRAPARTGMSSFADSLAAGNDEDMDYDEDNVGYKPSSSVLDDSFGGGANEGEDEMDVVIVDKAERAAFKQTRRKAMEESVELAQEEDEPSDWEREQLRNAGISLRLKTPKSAATAKLPEDSGGFSFDDAFVNMVISEEENQLNIEQGRLEKLQAQLQRSKEKALAVQNSLKQAEAQLDHFTSMAKTLQRQQ